MTVPAVPAAKFDRVLSFNIVAIALEFPVRNDPPHSSRSCSQCIRVGSAQAKRARCRFPYWGALRAIDQSGLKAVVDLIPARGILESDGKQLPRPGKGKSY